ncbi:histidine kinase [Terrabacter sp. NPDC080008]|uniref:sensor histidine kinase n=1 Tax=Terrabacter sp. NPDC080008 TaxID=3155176 RepID=UPI00344EDD44
MSTTTRRDDAAFPLATASGDRRWRRGVRALGLVVAFATVAASLHDLHGSAAALLVVAAALWVVELLATPTDVRVEAGLLLLIGLGGAGLNALAAESAGFLFAYFAAAAIGLRLPTRPAVAVLGVLVLAMAAAVIARGGNHTASSLAADLLGVAFAGSVAAAMRSARQAHARSAALVEALEQSRAAQAEAAALAERARLAREIHDILAHSLSGQVMSLEAASMLAERTGADERVRDQIDRAHHLARAGLDETRQAIQALRGQDAPDSRRIAELARDASRSHGLDVELTTTGTPRPLAPEAALTLYRTVQEGLTNTAKHAGRGASCTVRLDWSEQEVELTMTDRRPTTPSAASATSETSDVTGRPALPGSGYGLTGLRERAELAGGGLEAHPTVGGFALRLTLPYLDGTAP